MSVAVVIPSIPSRWDLLCHRAIFSVAFQTKPVDYIMAIVDYQRLGAAETRNRGVQAVVDLCEWIAFLDDDDELLPYHIEHLIDLAQRRNADVAWGWYEVIGGSDPMPHFRGKQFDVHDPHSFPITCVVRSDVVKRSKAKFANDLCNTGNWHVQDFPFWKAIADAGGKFIASDVITWKWHHHGKNTSGLPSRW